MTPDTTPPDPTPPHGSLPHGSLPDATPPHGSLPDMAAPDGSLPDGVPPDPAPSDAARSVAALPDAAPPETALIVCTTCRRPGHAEGPRCGARLAARLRALGLRVQEQECLSACARGCAVAFAGPGRWTFLQGGLDPDADGAAIAAMARAHAAAPRGLVPWRERPEVIRRTILARIPPLAPQEP